MLQALSGAEPSPPLWCALGRPERLLPENLRQVAASIRSGLRRFDQAAWQIPHPVDHAFSVKRRAVKTIEYQMPVKRLADAKGPNALELGMAKVPGSDRKSVVRERVCLYV